MFEFYYGSQIVTSSDCRRVWNPPNCYVIKLETWLKVEVSKLWSATPVVCNSCCYNCPNLFPYFILFINSITIPSLSLRKKKKSTISSLKKLNFHIVGVWRVPSMEQAMLTHGEHLLMTWLKLPSNQLGGGFWPGKIHWILG